MAVLALIASAPAALAADPPAVPVPKLGHFRSVLAQGEGQQLNVLE